MFINKIMKKIYSHSIAGKNNLYDYYTDDYNYNHTYFYIVQVKNL